MSVSPSSLSNLASQSVSSLSQAEPAASYSSPSSIANASSISSAASTSAGEKKSSIFIRGFHALMTPIYYLAHKLSFITTFFSYLLSFFYKRSERQNEIAPSQVPDAHPQEPEVLSFEKAKESLKGADIDGVFQRALRAKNLSLEQEISLWNDHFNEFDRASFKLLLSHVTQASHEDILKYFPNWNLTRKQALFIIGHLSQFQGLSSRELVMLVSLLFSNPKLSINDQIERLLFTAFPSKYAEASEDFDIIKDFWLQKTLELLEKVEDFPRKELILHGMENVIKDEDFRAVISQHLSNNTLTKVHFYAGQMANYYQDKIQRMRELNANSNNFRAYYIGLGQRCEVNYVREALHQAISREALEVMREFRRD